MTMIQEAPRLSWSSFYLELATKSWSEGRTALALHYESLAIDEGANND